MIKLWQMDLKGINWVQKDKIRSNNFERSLLGYTIQKSGHMVLNGVNLRSTMIKLGQMVLKGLNLHTQYKNLIIWS